MEWGAGCSCLQTFNHFISSVLVTNCATNDTRASDGFITVLRLVVPELDGHLCTWWNLAFGVWHFLNVPWSMLSYPHLPRTLGQTGHQDVSFPMKHVCFPIVLMLGRSLQSGSSGDPPVMCSALPLEDWTELSLEHSRDDCSPVESLGEKLPLMFDSLLVKLMGLHDANPAEVDSGFPQLPSSLDPRSLVKIPVPTPLVPCGSWSVVLGPLVDELGSSQELVGSFDSLGRSGSGQSLRCVPAECGLRSAVELRCWPSLEELLVRDCESRSTTWVPPVAISVVPSLPRLLCAPCPWSLIGSAWHNDEQWSSPGGGLTSLTIDAWASAVKVSKWGTSDGSKHNSLMLMRYKPFLLSFNVKLIPSRDKKHWLVAKSMRAPSVFMVWIDNKNGVALGTTSINSQIFCFGRMMGMRTCMKLCVIWLLPNLKPTLLGTCLIMLRTRSGNFFNRRGNTSDPITLRLAPVSRMANPCSFSCIPELSGPLLTKHSMVELVPFLPVNRCCQNSWTLWQTFSGNLWRKQVDFSLDKTGFLKNGCNGLDENPACEATSSTVRAWWTSPSLSDQSSMMTWASLDSSPTNLGSDSKTWDARFTVSLVLRSGFRGHSAFQWPRSPQFLQWVREILANKSAYPPPFDPPFLWPKDFPKPFFPLEGQNPLYFFFSVNLERASW